MKKNPVTTKKNKNGVQICDRSSPSNSNARDDTWKNGTVGHTLMASSRLMKRFAEADVNDLVIEFCFEAGNSSLLSSGVTWCNLSPLWTVSLVNYTSPLEPEQQESVGPKHEQPQGCGYTCHLDRPLAVKRHPRCDDPRRCEPLLIWWLQVVSNPRTGTKRHFDFEVEICWNDLLFETSQSLSASPFLRPIFHLTTPPTACKWQAGHLKPTKISNYRHSSSISSSTFSILLLSCPRCTGGCSSPGATVKAKLDLTDSFPRCFQRFSLQKV